MKDNRQFSFFSKAREKNIAYMFIKTAKLQIELFLRVCIDPETQLLELFFLVDKKKETLISFFLCGLRKLLNECNVFSSHGLPKISKERGPCVESVDKKLQIVSCYCKLQSANMSM